MTFIIILIILAGGLVCILISCGIKSNTKDKQTVIEQKMTERKDSDFKIKKSIETIDIVDKYINSDDLTREAIEKEVGKSDKTLGSLIGFIDKCAVLAIRQNDVEYIYKGLYANVIEGCRQDFRDNIICLTKLYHSCLILGLDSDKEFMKIVNKTNGIGKDLIEKFVNRNPVDKTLKCMGLMTTFTPQFDFLQVDFDNNLSKNQYSEITDKQIINGCH